MDYDRFAQPLPFTEDEAFFLANADYIPKRRVVNTYLQSPFFKAKLKDYVLSTLKHATHKLKHTTEYATLRSLTDKIKGVDPCCLGLKRAARVAGKPKGPSEWLGDPGYTDEQETILQRIADLVREIVAHHREHSPFAFTQKLFADTQRTAVYPHEEVVMALFLDASVAFMDNNGNYFQAYFTDATGQKAAATETAQTDDRDKSSSSRGEKHYRRSRAADPDNTIDLTGTDPHQTTTADGSPLKRKAGGTGAETATTGSPSKRSRADASAHASQEATQTTTPHTPPSDAETAAIETIRQLQEQLKQAHQRNNGFQSRNRQLANEIEEWKTKGTQWEKEKAEFETKQAQWMVEKAVLEENDAQWKKEKAALFATIGSFKGVKGVDMDD